MNIGIDASFLRRSGTGIGQVTVNFLKKLAEYQRSNAECQRAEFFLYCEERPALDFTLPENFHVRSFLPTWWKRDDVPRRWLWERALAERAVADGCGVFLSLSQSSAIMPKDVRHAMIVHDIVPRLFPEYLGTVTRKLYWRSVERGIRDANHIIAVSEKTKSDIVSTLGVPAETVSVAYPDCDPSFRNVLDTDGIVSVMRKYDLEPGYLYHGGGLEVRKNTGRLLRAYAALRTKRGRKLPPLVISGRTFPASNTLATDVRGIIRELGLEESVSVLGFVPDEDLPALYRGALLFAYPSLYEGFGLPVLEAFVSGTPVLAGRAGSVPELADGAALLVNPESEAEIRSGMEQLLDHAGLREELSKNGHVRAANFSWETFVKKVIEQTVIIS